jgi:hypothetical protein
MKSVIRDKLQMKQAIINRNNQHKKTLWATRIQRRSLILRDQNRARIRFHLILRFAKGIKKEDLYRLEQKN